MSEKSDILGKIAEIMKRGGLDGDPKKHIILWGWNQITDRWGTYRVTTTPPPRPVRVGLFVYVTERVDSADLIQATVLEDRGDRLWLKHPEIDVEFAVPFEDVHWTPIPNDPTAIHRRDLEKYIGRKAVTAWREMGKKRAAATLPN